MEVKELPRRPKPKVGESLTSFIFRLCNLNRMDIVSFLKLISNSKIYLTDLFKVDIFPKCFINLHILSKLSKVSIEELEALTISSLRINYYDHSHDEEAYIRISRVFKKDVRMFCRLCLKENRTFDLLWQVNGIHTCRTHHTKLTNRCGSCGESQKYGNKLAPFLKCSSCECELFKGEIEHESYDDVIRQLNIYKDWVCILDTDKPFVKKQQEYSMEHSCLLVLLYFKDELKVSLPRLGISRIRESINSGKSLGNFSLISYLGFVREMRLSVFELSEVKLSNELIESILSPKPIKNEPGSCLSPWCKFHKSSKAMRKIPSKSANNYFACEGCFMKYKIHYMDRRWIYEGEGETFKLYWEEIYPLLTKEISNVKIRELIKLSDATLVKAAAYFSHFYPELAKMRGFSDFKNASLYSKEFTLLIESDLNERGMRKFAKDKWGWGQKKFYYYLMSPEMLKETTYKEITKNMPKRGAANEWGILVQEEIDKMISDNMSISVSEIAERLNCKRNTLLKNGLCKVIHEAKKRQLNQNENSKIEDIKNKVSMVLTELLSDNKNVKSGEIFNFIKFDKSTRDPNLKKWIMEQICKHNNLINDESDLRLLNKAKIVANQLHLEMKGVTRTQILKILGIEWKTVCKKYKRLQVFLNDLVLEISRIVSDK